MVFVRVCLGSWADRSPLHEAASQGRLLVLRTLLAQVRHTPQQQTYRIVILSLLWLRLCDDK